MKRPSLTKLFEAPDEYVGVFGWLCSYTADALFLNEAIELFTRTTAGRRAMEGRVALALMCDPGQGGLSMLDVPGLAHLPALKAEGLPFRLLHAKVALLAYRRQTSEPGWRLRLIVSTGNWTVQTLEDSLDLAWCVEVGSDEMGEPNANLAQRCADLAAAADLLAWLRPLFDDRLLTASIHGQAGPTAQAMKNLDDWLRVSSRCVEPDTRPHFFDNRKNGLVQQLPDMIAGQAGKVSRNRLVMGSGFYEGAQNGNATRVPSVLERIAQDLQNNGLLTKSAEIDLFVNESGEHGCQAVADAKEAILNQKGWHIRPPGRPAELFGADSRRMLHAKFLLSWNGLKSSQRCSSAWIYLGSGNLTNPGFIQAAARGRGNLEAGVVFDPGKLILEPNESTPHVPAVTSLLPVQFQIELDSDSRLCFGDEMQPRPPAYEAAPIAWLQWQQPGHLTSLGSESAPYEVMDTDGRVCVRSGDAWLWPGDCPRQVFIRWGDAPQREALVPVQDAFGRMASLPLSCLQLDEVGRLLDAFPALAMPDDDDDALLDDLPPNAAPATSGGRPATDMDGAYAVRSMMMQLESIAAKQTEVCESDWMAWCLRLEQVLTQAAESADVAAFRDLALDPLGALRAGPFRPGFALDSSTEAGRSYEAVLDRIAIAWRVQGMVSLGAAL